MMASCVSDHVICQSGRTSAPLFPHALHVKRSSMSDSLNSSGQWSALIACEWLHL